MTKLEGMIGKTIVSVQQQKLANYDDKGFLRIGFSDGTHCTIEGGYTAYTGKSEGEYRTNIGIAYEERENQLVNL